MLAAFVAIPLAFILKTVFSDAGDGWEIVSELLLKDYIFNTLLMLGLVGISTVLLGVVAAWVVSIYEFPGKQFFAVALMFPLAIPTYVAAYGYSFLLETGNPLLFWIREQFGPEAMSYADTVRTYTIASFVLTVALYPYVYVAARTSFADFSHSYLESSRSLGRGLWSSFLRIALPLARPAIVGGTSLVVMEVLNEYGAMQYFGISTMTTGIFLLWSNMGDLESAVRLAGIMLLIVFSLILIERSLRGRRKYHAARTSKGRGESVQTGTLAKVLCVSFCSLIFLTTFLIPVGHLLRLATKGIHKTDLDESFSLVAGSLGVAGMTACIILGASLFLAYATRLYPSLIMRFFSRVALLGYALPGAVIAVAILVTSGVADSWLRKASEQYGWSPDLLFTGTMSALLIAYTVRFLAVGLQPVEAGMKRINPHIDEASASLGRSRLQSFFRLHLPLLRYPALGALIVLFVDLMKELPLTLILRPFGFNTLATRTYGLMQGEERLAEGAVPALILIGVGLISVVLLRRLILRQPR